jgi:hypothetical protein
VTSTGQSTGKAFFAQPTDDITGALATDPITAGESTSHEHRTHRTQGSPDNVSPLRGGALADQTGGDRSTRRQLDRPLPCRYCGERTWLVDGSGPLHPCCRFWMEDEGRRYCVACRTTKALAEHGRRFGVRSRTPARGDFADRRNPPRAALAHRASDRRARS